MCMCVCVCLCIHVCLRVCVFVCLRACVFVCVFVCVCGHVYMHVYMYVYVYVHEYVCVKQSPSPANSYSTTHMCVDITYKRERRHVYMYTQITVLCTHTQIYPSTHRHAAATRWSYRNENTSGRHTPARCGQNGVFQTRAPLNAVVRQSSFFPNSEKMQENRVQQVCPALFRRVL